MKNILITILLLCTLPGVAQKVEEKATNQTRLGERCRDGLSGGFGRSLRY